MTDRNGRASNGLVYKVVKYEDKEGNILSEQPTGEHSIFSEQWFIRMGDDGGIPLEGMSKEVESLTYDAAMTYDQRQDWLRQRYEGRAA